MATNLPPELKKKLLPDPNLSVLQFLSLSFPPILSHKSSNLQVANFIALDAPTMADDDLEILKILAVPPSHLVKSLSLSLGVSIGKHRSIRMCHIPGMENETFPLWIVSYWTALVEMWEIRLEWMNAEAFLQARRRFNKDVPQTLPGLAESVYALMGGISWSGDLKGFSVTVHTRSLATYASQNWFSDEHESQMLEILEEDLLRNGVADGVEIQPSLFFFKFLQDAYQERMAYEEKRSPDWLYKIGERFARKSSKKLAMITNVGTNHWVAVILSFAEGIVWYGDSLCQPMDDNMRLVLSWWTHLHSSTHFTHKLLPTTEQSDSFSCGILAWNTLASFFIKNINIIDPKCVGDERLKLFLRIAERHNSQVRIISAHLSTQINEMLQTIPQLATTFDITSTPLQVSEATATKLTVCDPTKQICDVNESLSEPCTNAVSVSEYSVGSDESTFRSPPPSDSPTTSSLPSPSQLTKSLPFMGSTLPKRELIDHSPPPETKRARTQVASNTRKALAVMDESGSTTKSGLLSYFQKATEEEKKANLMRDHEHCSQQIENRQFDAKKIAADKRAYERELARIRQQRRRQKVKGIEIDRGLRSPGGRKNKVSCSIS